MQSTTRRESRLSMLGERGRPRASHCRFGSLASAAEEKRSRRRTADRQKEGGRRPTLLHYPACEALTPWRRRSGAIKKRKNHTKKKGKNDTVRSVGEKRSQELSRQGKSPTF